MADHFHFSPSMLGTAIKCHGYYHARQKWPDNGSNEAAEYGTAAHWYSEGLGTAPVGTMAPNNVLIDQDIELYTRDYIARIKELTTKFKYSGIERKVDIPMLLEGMFGTVDLWAYDPATWTLYVEDLKFGMVPVEADENYQLIAYALGLLHTLGFDGHTEQNVIVKMTIHQPRAWHPLGKVRTWTVKATDLRAYANIIVNAINAILRDGDTTFTSGSHCKYCSGKLNCPAAITAGYNAIDVVTRGVFTEGHTVSELENMFVTLSDAKRAIDNLYNVVELTLQSEIEKGAHVTRVGIEKGQARRKWSHTDAEILALGKLFGLQLSEEKVITPAKAEKLGIDREVIKPYITRTHTAPKLKVRHGKSFTEKVFSNG